MLIFKAGNPVFPPHTAKDGDVTILKPSIPSHGIDASKNAFDNGIEFSQGIDASKNQFHKESISHNESIPWNQFRLRCGTHTGACICKPFKETRNRFPAWLNRFLGQSGTNPPGLLLGVEMGIIEGTSLE
jgi:hypothetical protein